MPRPPHFGTLHTVDCVSQCGRLGVGLVVRVVWGCPCFVRSVVCAFAVTEGAPIWISIFSIGRADREPEVFQVSACGVSFVWGFEAERGQSVDGQARRTGVGTREGGEPPRCRY